MRVERVRADVEREEEKGLAPTAVYHTGVDTPRNCFLTLTTRAFSPDKQGVTVLLEKNICYINASRVYTAVV